MFYDLRSGLTRGPVRLRAGLTSALPIGYHTTVHRKTQKKRKDIVTCNIVVYQSEGEKKKISGLDSEFPFRRDFVVHQDVIAAGWDLVGELVEEHEIIFFDRNLVVDVDWAWDNGSGCWDRN